MEKFVLLSMKNESIQRYTPHNTKRLVMDPVYAFFDEN